MMILLALTVPLIASGSQADGACTSQDAGPVHISLKTFGASGTVRTSAILEEVDRIWAPYDVRFAWHVSSPQGGATRDAAPIDLWIQLLHDSEPASDTHGRALVLGKSGSLTASRFVPFGSRGTRRGACCAMRMPIMARSSTSRSLHTPGCWSGRSRAPSLTSSGTSACLAAHTPSGLMRARGARGAAHHARSGGPGRRAHAARRVAGPAARQPRDVRRTGDAAVVTAGPASSSS